MHFPPGQGRERILIEVKGIGIPALALVALVSGCGGGSTAVGAAGPPASPVTTLPDCPPQLPPGAPPCDPAQVEANRAALRAQIARQWPVSSANPLSRDDAIAIAEKWSPARGEHAKAKKMTYAQANPATRGDAANPFVDPKTQVWVVSVYGPPGGAIYRPPPPHEDANHNLVSSDEPPPGSYTVILDAANGGTIDSCAPACY